MGSLIVLVFLVIDTAALVAQSEIEERLVPGLAVPAVRAPRAPDVQLAVSAWLARGSEAEGGLGFATADTVHRSAR